MVKGRSDLFFRLEIIKKVYGLTMLCCTLPFGLVVFCCGGIVSSILSLIVNTYYTGKLINIGFIKQMRDLMPIFFNCLVMGALCVLVQIPLNDNFIKLLVAIPIGAIYYILSNYLVRSSELKELATIIRKK